MDRRVLGWILVAVGAVVIAVSALADPLGIGADDTGFGTRQVIGVVIGAVVLAVGLGLRYWRREGGALATNRSDADIEGTISGLSGETHRSKRSRRHSPQRIRAVMRLSPIGPL